MRSIAVIAPIGPGIRQGSRPAERARDDVAARQAAWRSVVAAPAWRARGLRRRPRAKRAALELVERHGLS